MSKTLTCPGPPEHTFEHAGGRGRPPKFCPEHKPVKPAPKSSKTVVAEVNDDASVNPFVKKAQDQKKAEDKKKMEDVRAGKDKKRVETVKEEIDRLESEYAGIDARIDEATKQYQISLKATRMAKTTEDISKAFNHCDIKQNALINLAARKRFLEKKVEDLTDPNKVQSIQDSIDAPADPPEAGSITKYVDGDFSKLEEEIARVDDEAVMQEEYESQGEEDESGYNDLLSNPEQFDDEVADAFADLFSDD